MKKTLEKLWNGNIAPGENCGANDPEIMALIALMERNKNELGRTLNPQQQERFQKYIDCAQEYSYLITAQAFGYGFCLASKLLTEALSEDG